MIFSEFNITLDIHDVNPQTAIRVKKRDTCRRLNVTLSEKGEPYPIAADCSAYFTGVKPDKNKLFNPCVIIGDTIQYDFTLQTTIAAGLVKAEIRLMGSNGDELTSPSFYIIVDDTLYEDEDLIESTPEGIALKDFAALVEETEQKLANGEFDGVSPTVEIIPFEGGNEIVITDRDGAHSFRVLNSEGAGLDGVGIQSVVQTTTSTEDGGENIITVTKTNGTSSTFSVRNGSKGSQGEKGDQGEQGIQGEKGEKGDKGDTGAQGEQGLQGIQGEKGEKGDKGDKGDTGAAGAAGATGADGYTPVKGTDYWTAAEQEAITAEAAEQVKAAWNPLPIEKGGTGAASALEALKILGGMGITHFDGTSAVNVNNLTEFGVYFFQYATGVYTNLPPNNGGLNGWLLVLPDITDKNVKQIWLRMGSEGNQHNTYVRTIYGYNGTISDWAKVMTSKDFTLTNGVLHINTL